MEGYLLKTCICAGSRCGLVAAATGVIKIPNNKTPQVYCLLLEVLSASTRANDFVISKGFGDRVTPMVNY